MGRKGPHAICLYASGFTWPRTHKRHQSYVPGGVLWRLLSLLLILTFLSTWATSQTEPERKEQFSERVWQARDGLPQSAVQAITQTPDGYLWVGTSSGLVRFDGSRFVVFNHTVDKAFADDSVWSLTVAADGTLWIGTEGGGLIRRRDGVFKRYAGSAGLKNLFVRAICVQSNGLLWVGTDNGLYEAHVSGSDVSLFQRVDGTGAIPSMNIYTIRSGRNGVLYVGGSGLLELGAGGPRSFHPLTGSDDRVVGAVQVTRDGTLWIGTQAYLRSFRAGSPRNPFDLKSRVSLPTTTDVSYSGGENKRIHVSVFTEATDGSLWIGTYGEGVLRWKDGSFRWFEAPEYLPDNHINTIFEDAQNDIWIGTPSGLTRLEHTAANSIRLAGSIPVDVNSVSSGPGGSVLLASLGGKLFQGSDSSLIPVSLPGLPKDLAIRTTYKDRSGVLWVGTSGEGLYSIANVMTTHYSTPDFVRAFAEAPGGGLWIGTDGTLWSSSGSRFSSVPENTKRSLRALAFDRRGVLWVGSDNGLERIANGTVLHDPALRALDTAKVWSLLADREGDMWIGSRGTGLYLWRDGRLKHYAAASGFPSDNIYSIIEDDSHRIWISSPEGVWSIDRGALVTAAETGNFGSSTHFYGDTAAGIGSEMSGGVQPSGVLTSDGDLWFAAADGALRIRPSLSPPARPFPLIIEQIRTDGQPTPASSPVRVPAGTQQIEIDYAAVRLDSPDLTRFRYRLEGLEARWTDADTRRAAFYTHIPPGAYRFRVEAFDPGSPDRLISAELPVTIEPHVYQTIWFYMSCALLIVLAIASVFYLHRRRLHERFEAVLAERNRVAREMHDTVIQGCIGVSTLLEAAHNTEHSFPQKSRLLIERATLQNKQTIDEARQAVWNLRHEGIPQKQLPFGYILTSLVADLRDETEMPISLEITEMLPVLGVDTGESLLCVIREAMLNAIRHSDAQEIHVRTQVRRRQLTLDVTDDGHGFSVEQKDPLHYGIAGMRERVAGLGGRFSVISKPGEGTTVRVSLPLKESNKNIPGAIV